MDHTPCYAHAGALSNETFFALTHESTLSAISTNQSNAGTMTPRAFIGGGGGFPVSAVRDLKLDADEQVLLAFPAGQVYCNGFMLVGSCFTSLK
jgi:hypothetical protein